MKVICLDARMLGHSGIGTYIKNLIEHLATAPFKLRLIAHPQWSGKYDIIPSTAPIYSVQEQLELPRLIPKCDVFWSPHYNIPLLPIKAQKRLVTIHDVCHLAQPLPFLKRLYAKAMLRQAAQRADRLITISNFSREEIVKYTRVPKDKITVIYNGVDQRHFCASPTLKENYILFVGNRKQHKNLAGLIRAMDFLKDKNLRLVVLADGTASSAMLRSLYQGARVLVIPSFYEGFGLPALEAMSCGCPVVAARAASLPEVCGGAAEYVDPADPQDIARGIAAALDRAESLIEQGILHCKKFTWEKAAVQHLATIAEL